MNPIFSKTHRVLIKVLLCVLLLQTTAVAQDTITEDEVAVEETIADTELDTSFLFSHIDASGIHAVQEREIPDSIIQKLLRDDAFWYANVNFKKKAEPKKDSNSFLERFLNQQWMRILLWFIIIAAFLGVLGWYFATTNIGLFRKRAAAVPSDKEEYTEQDIFEIDYNAAIAKAVSAQNFRLAIRLHYLQLLKTMAQKNIIQYKQDKTNSDYLMQLYRTDYYKPFFKLTRYFEYTWYGQVAVAPTAYNAISTDFVTFKNSMDF